MLLMTLIVLGLALVRAIPLRLLPAGLDPPFLWLWAAYPGSTPLENSRRIARPLEESFASVKGLREVYSRSDVGGTGVFLEFANDADMDVAYLQVRDQLERARRDLPSDLRFIYLRRYNDTDETTFYFGISFTGYYEDPYRIVREEVVRKLERIDGVAAVEMWGGREKMVRVELDLALLKASRMDPSEVVRQVREADFAVASGYLEDGGTRFMVRSDGRLGDIESLENLPLTNVSSGGNSLSGSSPLSSSGGTMTDAIPQLRLKDLARVTYAAPRAEWFQRIGRRPSLQMGVFKQSEANTVELCYRLEEALDEMRQDPKLAGMKFELLFDQGRFIRKSLWQLVEAGLWGGLFAIVILFYFLRRIGMTLYVASSIPLALLSTIVVLYFMGWSLDVVTLSGLMISVGMVVDNAIVVVENISTRRQYGDNRLDAVSRGATEVALAITLATGTTMVVFLPVMLLSGNRIFSFYMLRIGMPVVIALAASLLVALLFIPLAASRLEAWGTRAPNTSGGGNRLVIRCSLLVESLVRLVLRRRRDAFLIALIIFATIAWPASHIISTDEEEGNINDFNLRFDFPAYYTLADIDSTLRSLEERLYQRAGRYDIKTVVTGYRRGFGRMRIFLNERSGGGWLAAIGERFKRLFVINDAGRLERKEIAAELRDSLNIPPGVRLFTSWRRGAGKEDAEYVTLFGDDQTQLDAIASDIERRLQAIPNLLTLERETATTSEEAMVEFDRNETGRHRINAMQAAIGINAMLRGVDLREVYLDDIAARVPLRVELQESDRGTLEQLMNLPVGAGTGPAVRLADVSRFRYERGAEQIERENRRTRLRIKISSSSDDPGKLGRQIDAALIGLTLPSGYEWTKGRRFAEIEEQGGQQRMAWLLAATFVMLLMGALFESFLLPWAVIVTVPFSFFGVWWMLYLTGTQFGVMAGVGVVILIGVVVNNAIVLVDRVNRLREEGLSRNEALAIGARERFRPIAMTALTTICGLLPMALGGSSLMGVPYAPMGRTIIGGLLAATLSTPVVVPLVYSLLDDFRIAARSLLRRMGA
ncbi:MAG: efflux RND transporter permease subunit, partial [Calditrichaeota bacterium]|nr:efflux RND transporter permease subunit [Calditrichota bacterium]